MHKTIQKCGGLVDFSLMATFITSEQRSLSIEQYVYASESSTLHSSVVGFY